MKRFIAPLLVALAIVLGTAGAAQAGDRCYRSYSSGYCAPRYYSSGYCAPRYYSSSYCAPRYYSSYYPSYYNPYAYSAPCYAPRYYSAPCYRSYGGVSISLPGIGFYYRH